jgi:hypothetical protein
MKKIQILILLVLFAFVATQVVAQEKKVVVDKKAATEACEQDKVDAKKTGECCKDKEAKADAKAGECCKDKEAKADAKAGDCCEKDKADAKKADVKKAVKDVKTDIKGAKK